MGMCRTDCLRLSFIIFLFSVFRNGDLLCPPFRFIIPRSMRQDLEQILSLITEKVSLRTGAVRRSERLSGRNSHALSVEYKWRDGDLVNISFQVVHFGRSDCVLSRGAWDWPLLRCRGNREVQETSICGAVGFKSHREVLSCKVLCMCVKMCVYAHLCQLLCFLPWNEMTVNTLISHVFNDRWCRCVF